MKKKTNLGEFWFPDILLQGGSLQCCDSHNDSLVLWREKGRERERGSRIMQRERESLLSSDLSSDLEYHPPVKPRFWPWLELCFRRKA